MTERRNISSGTAWEKMAGYSRAVRVGNLIWVAGTTATDASGQVQGQDAPSQARYILQKIEAALHEAGASLADVVRTRIYLTSLDNWEAVARVHGEVFGGIRPANSLIQVVGLVEGRLVEIEADAIVRE